jgi:hypothetical protein
MIFSFDILDSYAAQYGRKVPVDPRTLPRSWMHAACNRTRHWFAFKMEGRSV